MDTLPPHAQNGNPLPIPAVPGIYKITCATNGKIYVGSAVDLRHRYWTHWNHLRKNTHHNQHLQHAWNKYGEQAFMFEVLELVLIREMTTAREQYWFKKLNPFGERGFNIARDTTAPALGMKHTPEAIEKARQAKTGKKLSPEAVEKNRQSHLGKTLSPETRKKLSLARLGNKNALGGKGPRGVTRSPETREKLRQANLGKKQSPETIEKRMQAHRGKKRSPETREKIRQANLARWEKAKKEKLDDQNAEG